MLKGVMQPKKLSVQFESGGVLTLSDWCFCIPPPSGRHGMSSRAVVDIQRSLSAIRGELEGANLQTQLDALLLMLSASERVIELARKLAAPAQKQTKKPKRTKRIAKTIAKPAPPQTPIKQTGAADTGAGPTAQKPVAPLANQRKDRAGVEIGP